jgi:CRP-like cAMP-binding protein
MPKTPGSKTIEPSILGLARVRLLESVPRPDVERLAQQCRWRRILATQRVISRDAQDQDVYLIVSGRVRVTSFSAAGRQVTYRDIAAGDWFGDFAAIDGMPRSADVDALEDSVVAVMSPAVFRKLLHEHPDACDLVLRRLVGSVRDLTERIFDLSTLGVQNRVHAELLRLGKQAGIKANAARIDPVPTHAEIASQVGTYREQVTREISAMVRQGLIQRAGRALVIPDVARLEQAVAEVRRSP